ncbi:MAG: hypothetical protein R3D55_25870 [Chloroflexota bacterium]
METKDKTAVGICLSKRIYRSAREARRMAAKNTRLRGIVFTDYRCPVCYWWHLTSGGYVEEKS